MAKQAWIHQTVTGLFFIYTNNSLFPGYRNKVYAFWKQKQSARNYCNKIGYDLQQGECPLPQVPDEVREAYRQ